MNTNNIKDYPYTLVLTHDVDNISLRCYPLFSKMTLSFFKRCLFNNFLRAIKGEIKFSKYLDSIKWCIFYPFIKLGIVNDPWEKVIFDIMSLEKKYGVYSTFFFMPFPDRPGHIKEGVPAKKDRSSPYNVRKYKKLLQKMELEGWEVGVHGIDAHINADCAKEELNVIKALLPDKEKIGMRMHWLYQSESLWKNLKHAGFYYDATFGSNNEVGFPHGKMQPFKKDNLWVIPLNIMDSTLLGHWLKGLSLDQAWFEIEKILNIAKKESAVVTILWHTNTCTVFYYWGELYERIIKKAQSDNADIMKCIDLLDEMQRMTQERS